MRASPVVEVEYIALARAVGAVPASVFEFTALAVAVLVAPAPVSSTWPPRISVTGVGLIRDGVPDVVHQLQVSFVGPLQYGAHHLVVERR